MRHTILALLLSLVAPCTMRGQSHLAPCQETPEQKAQRMEWFDHAKLGIFIHWGIYAVNGISESWSFYNNYIPYEDYMNQCRGFTASAYNPQQWAALIKQSGAQYAVITTKHHDGVSLWNTKVSKLSTRHATAARRDVLTPFAKAIREQGLKLGFYYSLLDWSHPDYPNHTKTTIRYHIKDDPARWKRFLSFNNAQLSELSTTYHPDLFWFDGDWEQTAADWHASEIVARLRHDNSKVVINSRIQGYGDYATPEQGIPILRPQARYWELCATMNDSWGYQPLDNNIKPTHMLLRTFVDCLSKGGNLLLGIGPRADGTIPQWQQDVLKEFGRWTSKHHEAIYHTQAGLPAECFQGYTTLSPDSTTLYLYLPSPPGHGLVEVKGIANTVHRVWVVGNGHILSHKVYNKNFWNAHPGNIYISVPTSVLDPQITVLALLLDGPLRLDLGTGRPITAN